MSKFVIQKNTPREELDWGSLAWLSNPPTTNNKQLTIIDVVLTPGNGHNFHKHPAQEETIVVVSGEVEQWIGKEKKILKPGDAAYIDAGMVHASFNVGQTDAKLLAILGPCVGDIGYELTDVSAEEPWCNLRA